MSSTPARQNPFPGLRPFSPEEDYLFFGREEQNAGAAAAPGQEPIHGGRGDLGQRQVIAGPLRVALGTSGRGRMLEAGASWEIAVTHPGGNPLAILTDALLDADLYDRQVEHARENLLAPFGPCVKTKDQPEMLGGAGLNRRSACKRPMARQQPDLCARR